MADIVLRDRSGNPVEYPGVERIKLNTTDGGVQNFGAYDPDTLTPDKLANGVTVGGVTGELSIPESVEKEVTQDELNFAGGAIALTPDSGKVFSGVSIPVPDNLEAGNIAEGVNIAGIVGTLAAGGGSNVLIKEVTVNSSMTGVYTLVTAEELSTVGFDTSGKCFIGIMQYSRNWGYLSSPGTLMNAIVFNFQIGTSAYGFYLSGYTPSSSATITTGAITSNPFSGSKVSNTPYYAEGEIRYNMDGSMKLWNRDASTYYYTFFVVAGNLTPTV